MVLTRNSLNSLNIQESLPSSAVSETSVAASENVSNFDIGRSDEENDPLPKLTRATSRPLYKIGSDSENVSPQRQPRSRSFGGGSIRSELSSVTSKRLRTPRGQQLLNPGLETRSESMQTIRNPTYVESNNEEPLLKKTKTEISEFASQEDVESALGRTRQQTKRLNCVFSGVNTETCDEDNERASSGDENNEGCDDGHGRPSYNLRAERKAPEFFRPNNASKKRSSNVHVPQYFNMTLSSRIRKDSRPRKLKKRKSTRFHRSDDSSDSSSGSSSDERRFIRRKKRSMKRSRMSFLPMNLSIGDLTQTQRDRKAIGASLADVDPMNIDKSANFAAIGGLDLHIRALKEMIFLPFLYPELFARFDINPPRGCLFYGPPGTGKTLMGRALANECSRETGRKISFFMRKGADCLSKWVGESERQLRLLFDQAYIMRPSIIFFDEIDGLAPVRSSRQDQIHSSIVSTLLALMDGLDNRGEIIVIGATNRIDSIDPALRRPGRFDREFQFRLPDVSARFEIVKIATKSWNPPMSDEMMRLVAEKTHGYSGADLNLLCMEAALISTRRSFPQIYLSSGKLDIDISSINVEVVDIFNAMRSIKVSSTRVLDCPAKPLDSFLELLLGEQLKCLFSQINKVFHFEKSKILPFHDKDKLETVLDGLILPGDAENHTFDSLSNLIAPSSATFVRLSCFESDGFVEKLLLPAILNEYEEMQVYSLTHANLFGVSGSSPEEAAIAILKEASRSHAAVITIPNALKVFSEFSTTLVQVISEYFRRLSTFPGSFLVLATLPEVDTIELKDIGSLFGVGVNEFFEVKCEYPSKDNVRDYFAQIFRQVIKSSAAERKTYQDVSEFKKVPQLSKEGTVPLNANEIARIREKHFAIMRELRIYLRDVLKRLATDPEHRCFLKPVDRVEVADYYDVIRNPMDLTTMMSKTDSGQYVSVKQFLQDIDLIADNALEYNPVSDPQSLRVRHRACAFRDSAMSMVKMEIDSEFEEQCAESLKSFSSLGLKPQTEAPRFFFTKSHNKFAAGLNENFRMKLRSKDGELVAPLNPPPKVAGVVKRRVTNYSKGILNKYRKQRQQKQAMILANKSFSNEGKSKQSPFKIRQPSPLKPRITRSRASFISKICGDGKNEAEPEKVPEEKLTEESGSSIENNGVAKDELFYQDKMVSSDNELEQSRLLLELNGNDEANLNSDGMVQDESAKPPEAEELFKDVIFNGLNSTEAENNEGLEEKVVSNDDSYTSAVDHNVITSPSSYVMSPEIGAAACKAADDEKRKEELAEKLEVMNEKLLEAAVEKCCNGMKVTEMIALHTELRYIIHKYRHDHCDEKREMYLELRNILGCSQLDF